VSRVLSWWCLFGGCVTVSRVRVLCRHGDTGTRLVSPVSGTRWDTVGTRGHGWVSWGGFLVFAVGAGDVVADGLALFLGADSGFGDEDFGGSADVFGFAEFRLVDGAG
jgi:hypothetical protein